MKTKKVLKKLTLNKEEIVNLNDFEMRNLKGGATWDPATQSYWLPEITVYGTRPDHSIANCPYCQAFFNQTGYFDYQQGNPILGTVLTYGQVLVHYCSH